jgi:hypothetical protein
MEIRGEVLVARSVDVTAALARFNLIGCLLNSQPSPRRTGARGEHYWEIS